METPISSRRITRSQTKAAAANNSGIAVTTSDPVNGLIESRQRAVNQPPLFDITNDSPVFGLAMGEISKLRSGCKYKNREITTPGSGEALLRNQVKKILLQKVEEEEAKLSKISMMENEIVIAMDKGGEGIGSKKDLMITRSLLSEFLDEPAEGHDGSLDKGDVKNNQEEEEKDGYDDDSEMLNVFYEYFIKKLNVSEGQGEKTTKEDGEEEKRLKGGQPLLLKANICASLKRND